MQMNNNAVRGIRGVHGIVTSVIFLIVGAAFAGIGVYLLINPKGAENPNTTLDIVFIIAGAAVMVVSLLFLIHTVKEFKKRKPLSEEEVKANEQRIHAGEPDIQNIKNEKFFFHFGGKMNQSYFVEDQNGEKRFECILKKFNPVAANTYEFTDVRHNFTKTIKVGKTLTQSTEGGIIPVGAVLASNFKIDGVGCWDYLRNRGYEIKYFVLERPFVRFELYKFGKLVAKITPCNGKDPFNEKSMNFLRMGEGIFRIEIIDCRLDDAVMAAFIAGRTDTAR